MSSTSYKETLNLPQTSFPMKAGLSIREKEQIELWKERKIYQKMLDHAKDAPLYILHDGPPYANGNLHVGHALNKILKDVLVKYHAKRGFKSLYTPGWDCHGLPIEIQVQKKLSAPYSKNDLRKACRTHAENFVAIQKEEFLRLMILGDFQNRYATMDFSYEAEILGVLQTMRQKELLYRENRPVSWCIHCATALADAEIEYAQKESPSLYVSYPVRGQTDLSFLVWTTTPWTLPASVGLSLGGQISYGIFTDGTSRYILAKDLLEKVVQETKIPLEFCEDVSRDVLLSWVAEHPFLSRDIALILGDHVTLDAGTGIVHTAPAHGVDDFQVGYLEHQLPVIMLIDDHGKFSGALPEGLDFLSGENIWKANSKILQKLEENGRLFFLTTLLHSYPHCWRCKNPLITRATFQWFVRVSSLIPAMVREIEKVQFFPTGRKERMLKILENRPDWCISRQRAWGVPIPSLRCSCGHEFFHDRVLQVVKDKVKEQGADFWFDPQIPLEDFAPFVAQISCEQCGSTGNFQRGQDILDVWFDSSVSWKNLLDQYQLPVETSVDLYLEGNDQFRAWYQVSLISAIVEKDRAPYKAIFTHGMVLDENGRAMSKSLGNVLAPAQIVEQYGADILRLWVVSQNYTEDIRISPGILTQISDMYRKLRNTFRFLLSNLYDFPKDHWQDRDISTLHELDRWVLCKLDKLQKSCWNFYSQGQFDELTRAVFTFMNEDLSSFYLDVLKDPLYTLHPSDPQRRSAQYTMVILLQSLSDLLSPILSFTMEEVYGHLQGTFLPKGESIFLRSSESLDYSSFEESYQYIEKILELREKVLKELESLRQKKEIGSNLEAKVRISTNNKEILKMKSLDYYFIIAECELVETPAEALQIEAKKGTLEKCPRCYRYVALSPDTLCVRCQEVLQ